MYAACLSSYNEKAAALKSALLGHKPHTYRFSSVILNHNRIRMSQALIAALQNPALYPHPIESFQLIETHISWVLLTGQYVYKIKKPVDFGFVNFKTLADRKHYCELELMLNRRLTHDLYLEVVTITGSESAPQLGGSGQAIEYAVKMRQFAQDQLLTQLLARGELKPGHIDAMARQIAAFHQETPAAPADSPFGTPEHVMAPVQQNFDQIRPFLSEPADLKQLDALQAWAQNAYAMLKDTFTLRKAQGHVRECHGDIHLANAAIVNGEVTIFDCIEFNNDFRMTDVAADIGFLMMDLQARGLANLSNRCINIYLERSGDYAILAVLPFYVAYRAMVRAKVSLLAMPANPTPEERAATFEVYRRYATLAQRCVEQPQHFLAIMHGASGSGKSHVSMQLLEASGAIRLRSDVERKRLFVSAVTSIATDESIYAGIYSPQVSAQTYAHLHDLAARILALGYPVIIDATYLKHALRDAAHQTAQAACVPFAIIDCHAPDEVVKARLEQRRLRQVAHNTSDPSDADWHVAQAQKASEEPLTAAELEFTRKIDTQAPALGTPEGLRSLVASFV